MKTSVTVLFLSGMTMLFGLTESFVAPTTTTLSRRAVAATPQRLSAKKEKMQNARSFLSQDQKDDEGYGLVGTLTRQGPIPAFIRIFQADNYYLAVDKFMLQERCDRTEAMANMDAYFNDPIGWQLKRKEFEKTGVKYDYVNVGQGGKKLALTAFWGVVSTFYIWRIYQYTVNGVDYKENFWGF
jgi:hypothetical protein